MQASEWKLAEEFLGRLRTERQLSPHTASAYRRDLVCLRDYCEKNDIDFRFTLPHRRFHRTVGEFAGQPFDLEGNLMEREAYERKLLEWLPSQEDKAYVKSLMRAVTEPGKFADWIAPPLRGINSQEIDFEYVKL